MNTIWKKTRPFLGHMTAVAALVLAVSVNAQTTPTSPRTTAPDGGTMDSPPPRHERVETETRETPTTWQRFDASSNAELGLEDTQQDRLKDIDARYERELEGLGADGMNSARYNELNERRNEEVRGVLTEEQYERWSTSTTSPERD